MPPEEYSVSEFIAVVNATLDNVPARIVGEVSELKFAASGHAYFTLKDKETGFILPSTIWARDYALAGVTLELGMEVAATGRANFYGPFGKLSFNAKSVELVGEGALKKAYELLKKKLTAEGLFAPERKRALPAFVRRIGVITSVRGAVIHDFSSNLGRYGFQVRILDSKVEGPESGRDLALSVRAMREEEIDILVIIRGGGSIQSLAGFDNEALVREIASFPVPVLAGVGHHQDVTLAALAADFAESTPSFVAALINRSWMDAETALARSTDRIWKGFDGIVKKCQAAQTVLERAVIRMEFQFKRTREGMEALMEKALEGFQTALERAQDRVASKIPEDIFSPYMASLEAASSGLEMTAKTIAQNDPKRQLRLGYSIAYAGGTVIRSRKDAPAGTRLELHVADGTVDAKVVE